MRLIYTIMRFHVATALLCALSISTLYGQGNPSYNRFNADINNFIPVSPNAASLGKFGNIPVSYYTGLPAIEVPIYTIEQGDIKLPIKLSYHAGGIKVSEIASWVGLGFALNAGGTISCNYHGRPDIYATGVPQKVIDMASLTFMDYYDASRGMLDMEPDEYMLNMPGVSGKFVMSPQRQIYLTPSQPVKIEPRGEGDGTFNGYIGAWRVITADGVQYVFMAKEATSVETSDGTGMGKSTTAWNMTQIISADKADTIKFHYEPVAYSTYIQEASHYREFIELVASQGCDGGNGSAGSGGGISANHMATQRLRKITFAQGSIDFIPANDTRCDLQLDKALDRIVISDVNGTTVKEFFFRYGYMRDSQITPVEQYTCASGGAGERERLMLLSLQETGKSSYTFDYIHDLGLPTRQSTSQDHWGFCNKPHSDFGTLIPSLIRLSTDRAILGTGREPNLMYGKQGILRKIIYPTGGETEFTYKLNDAALTSLGNFQEFGEAYTITNVGPLSYQVDYGANNQQVATLSTKSLTNKTFISFKIEVYQEPVGTSVKLVNAVTNEEIYCDVGGQSGPVRNCNCGEVADATYKVVAIRSGVGGGQSTGQFFTLTLAAYKQTVPKNPGTSIPIGGLRIQRITDRDPLTGAVYEKDFEYSPGILTWGLKYTSIRKEYTCFGFTDGWPQSFYYSIGKFFVVDAGSNYPLSNTQGSPVGYSTVTVREFQTLPNGTRRDNGYTQFRYTTAATAASYRDEGFPSYMITGFPNTGSSGHIMPYGDNLSVPSYQFPFAAPQSNDWKRGSLLSKEVYKRRSDGSYYCVTRDVNDYTIVTTAPFLRGCKASFSFDGSNGQGRPSEASADEIVFSIYDIAGGYSVLRRSENHIIDDDGHDFMSSADYYYDNSDHLLPTRMVRNASDGSKTTSFTAYPQDYPAGTAFVDALVASHVWTKPVEQVVLVEDKNGIKRVREGILSTYVANGRGQLQTMYVLEANTGIDVAGFKFSNRPVGIFPDGTTTKATYSIDPLYKARVGFTYEYDRVKEQAKSNDVIHAYLWDATRTYPVAHVENALHNNIAYTGFEDDASGNWTVSGSILSSSYCYTGTRSLSMGENGRISRYGLEQQPYIVSYWSRNGSLRINGETALPGDTHSGWSYYEHRLPPVTASVSITGMGYIDELRLYPVAATMTTYAYKPLVGLSAITDANNQSTFYYYDAAGRLEVVRDFDGKILQYYKYHYKAQ